MLLARFAERSKFLAIVCALVGCLGPALAPPASADIRKTMKMCDGKLCPIFLPALRVPEDWTVDQAASNKMGLLILVPRGSDYQGAEALIYARAFHNTEKTTVEQRVAESNARWKKQVEDARIERLEDVAGSRSGNPFQLFHYSNPSSADQAAEIVAFGEDTDKEGNLYGVQVVLTARSEKALAANKDVLIAVLKAY